MRTSLVRHREYSSIVSRELATNLPIAAFAWVPALDVRQISPLARFY